MAGGIKKKITLGSARIDRFSPPLPEGTSKAINVHISFEEALKLHLSLGQALAQLNSYNRSTKRLEPLQGSCGVGIGLPRVARLRR